jgi:hypothetical protein
MLQIDPWSKAAECESAIQVVADPERRIVLDRLRRLWLALCKEQSFFERPDRAGQLANIAQIHRELMAACRRAMH